MRGAAIAVLCRHDRERREWFKRGLRDPEPCVRIETAAQLVALDPNEDPEIFAVALHDPNPDVERTAWKLCEGKKFEPVRLRENWRPPVRDKNDSADGHSAG